MNDLITVCMTTYNGEKYIKEQLDSILNQTYKNIEIIVQDDCSHDNTWNILQKYANTYENISVYKNEENLGYTKNFESVIQKANGAYIALSDQDDIFLPEKIEKLYNVLKNSEYVLSYSNSHLIDSNGNSLNKDFDKVLKINFIDSNTLLNFVYENCVSAHSMLFKKELLEYIFPFPKHFVFDAWIAACAANLKKGVKYLDEPLVLYRQHDNNALASYVKEKTKVKLSKTKEDRINRRIKTRELIISNITELLKCQSARKEDLIVLKKLLDSYKDFVNRYFDIKFFIFLLKNSKDLFKMRKKGFSKAFNYSKGLKLYKLLLR